MRALFIFGTRPEAIKMCPVIREMTARPAEFKVRVCVTGQHREMLDQVLTAFGVIPDWDLNVMRPGQSLAQSMSRMLSALETVLIDEKPDFVLVQGDTTTTVCGALAAFYGRVPVAHVEAGLRTGEKYEPFPEEMHRVLLGRIAELHFAATEEGVRNLQREGIDDSAITVTGNTSIDAVLSIRTSLREGRVAAVSAAPLDRFKKLILVTIHRRENFGSAFERISQALVRLALRDDVEIVYPVHPNPNIRDAAYTRLSGRPNIRLLDPLDYVSFVSLMSQADFLVTDSGGIQEEAPALGKPVLVLRDQTERREAVLAGTALLVGTDPARIVNTAEHLLDDRGFYASMSRRLDTYGDGQASVRIADTLSRHFARNRWKRIA